MDYSSGLGYGGMLTASVDLTNKELKETGIFSCKRKLNITKKSAISA